MNPLSDVNGVGLETGDVVVLPCTIVNIESGLSRNNLCLVPNLPGIAPTDQNFQIRVDGIQVVANTDGPVTVFGVRDSGESVGEAVDGEEG